MRRMATGARRVIVDTGPLVGWFDAADPSHAAVHDYLGAFEAGG